jgi:hypothetical protein
MTAGSCSHRRLFSVAVVVVVMLTLCGRVHGVSQNQSSTRSSLGLNRSGLVVAYCPHDSDLTVSDGGGSTLRGLPAEAVEWTDALELLESIACVTTPDALTRKTLLQLMVWVVRASSISSHNSTGAVNTSDPGKSQCADPTMVRFSRWQESFLIANITFAPCNGSNASDPATPTFWTFAVASTLIHFQAAIQLSIHDSNASSMHRIVVTSADIARGLFDGELVPADATFVVTRPDIWVSSLTWLLNFSYGGQLNDLKRLNSAEKGSFADNFTVALKDFQSRTSKDASGYPCPSSTTTLDPVDPVLSVAEQREALWKTALALWQSAVERNIVELRFDVFSKVLAFSVAQSEALYSAESYSSELDGGHRWTVFLPWSTTSHVLTAAIREASRAMCPLLDIAADCEVVVLDASLTSWVAANRSVRLLAGLALNRNQENQEAELDSSEPAHVSSMITDALSFNRFCAALRAGAIGPGVNPILGRAVDPTTTGIQRNGSGLLAGWNLYGYLSSLDSDCVTALGANNGGEIVFTTLDLGGSGIIDPAADPNLFGTSGNWTFEEFVSIFLGQGASASSSSGIASRSNQAILLQSNLNATIGNGDETFVATSFLENLNQGSESASNSAACWSLPRIDGVRLMTSTSMDPLGEPKYNSEAAIVYKVDHLVLDDSKTVLMNDKWLMLATSTPNEHLFGVSTTLLPYREGFSMTGLNATHVVVFGGVDTSNLDTDSLFVVQVPVSTGKDITESGSEPVTASPSWSGNSLVARAISMTSNKGSTGAYTPARSNHGAAVVDSSWWMLSQYPSAVGTMPIQTKAVPDAMIYISGGEKRTWAGGQSSTVKSEDSWRFDLYSLGDAKSTRAVSNLITTDPISRTGHTLLPYKGATGFSENEGPTEVHWLIALGGEFKQADFSTETRMNEAPSVSLYNVAKDQWFVLPAPDLSATHDSRPPCALVVGGFLLVLDRVWREDSDGVLKMQLYSLSLRNFHLVQQLHSTSANSSGFIPSTLDRGGPWWELAQPFAPYNAPHWRGYLLDLSPESFFNQILSEGPASITPSMCSASLDRAFLSRATSSESVGSTANLEEGAVVNLLMMINPGDWTTKPPVTVENLGASTPFNRSWQGVLSFLSPLGCDTSEIVIDVISPNNCNKCVRCPRGYFASNGRCWSCGADAPAFDRFDADCPAVSYVQPLQTLVLTVLAVGIFFFLVGAATQVYRSKAQEREFFDAIRLFCSRIESHQLYFGAVASSRSTASSHTDESSSPSTERALLPPQRTAVVAEGGPQGKLILIEQILEKYLAFLPSWVTGPVSNSGSVKSQSSGDGDTITSFSNDRLSSGRSSRSSRRRRGRADAYLVPSSLIVPQSRRVTIVLFQLRKILKAVVAEFMIAYRLNAFVERVGVVVQQYRGSLDSLIGDVAVVSFNAAILCSDHFVAAVDAAVAVTETPPLGLAIRASLTSGVVGVSGVGQLNGHRMLLKGKLLDEAFSLLHLVRCFPNEKTVVFYEQVLPVFNPIRGQVSDGEALSRDSDSRSEFQGSRDLGLGSGSPPISFNSILPAPPHPAELPYGWSTHNSRPSLPLGPNSGATAGAEFGREMGSSQELIDFSMNHRSEPADYGTEVMASPTVTIKIFATEAPPYSRLVCSLVPIKILPEPLSGNSETGKPSRARQTEWKVSTSEAYAYYNKLMKMVSDGAAPLLENVNRSLLPEATIDSRQVDELFAVLRAQRLPEGPSVSGFTPASAFFTAASGSTASSAIASMALSKTFPDREKD